MKKSELIKIIKEEIQNVLSEDPEMDKINKDIDDAIYAEMTKNHKAIRAAVPISTHSSERIKDIIGKELAKWVDSSKTQTVGGMRQEIARIVAAGIKNKFDFSKPKGFPGVVTGDTAKVRFLARSVNSMNRDKKEKLIQTYKKQLEQEYGVKWEFDGIKNNKAIFLKQQNVATTP